MNAVQRLLIVSGLSGAGKSVALHVLEDIGYYCIDNLPAALLESLLQNLTGEDASLSRIAVGVDARNPEQDLQSLPDVVQTIRSSGVQTEILFLQADDDILLKRYSESRRRHPLAGGGVELRDAIQRERDLLGPVINAADLVIDTSRTSIYELGDLIRERVDRRKPQMLSVLVESFGFKNGIPADVDFVFDMRCLPNPYWQPKLRPLTGLDAAVIEFLDNDPRCQAMYADVVAFFRRWIPEYVSFNRRYLTIGIGCTGGQHRSVYMAEKLAAALRELHESVMTRHSELNVRKG
ncbi:MAG: RNase adapter RapZ [Woeseiaceae bacterium]|nr:RNase adapter RapZ [Woeseiaceae bacterium]